jgi:predicted porin
LAVSQPARADVTLSQGDGAVPSVIAYLRVDAGLRFDTDSDLSQYNGKKKTGTIVQAGGNDWGTSMFGAHGTSELSPNLSAIYRVEAGFDATNGNYSGFTRRAYGGLNNKQLGQITFGKNLFIDNDIWDYDPMVQENMSTATLVNGRNWQHASDIAEYRSPNWGGFQFGGQASFNNGDTSGTTTYKYMTTRVSNMYGVVAKYTAGPVSLQAIYDEIQDGNGRLSSIFSASREGILSATWDVTKRVKLYGGYERLSAPDASLAKVGAANLGSTVYAGTSEGYNTATGIYATGADNGWFGAGIQVTPDIIVRGAWFYTAVNDHGGHANLATAGVEYYFSKNVFVYLTLGEVMNSGNADFSVNTAGTPPKPGHSQFGGFNGVSVQF